jgi:hypothetical protein
VSPINTKADLAEALSRPRAFVFLFVNWSGPAWAAQSIVRNVVESWQAARPDLAAPCYKADLSEQSGEVWDAVRAWLTAEGRPADALTFGGYGPILWLRSGRVIAHALPLSFGGGTLAAAKLSAVTAGIFGTEGDSV